MDLASECNFCNLTLEDISKPDVVAQDSGLRRLGRNILKLDASLGCRVRPCYKKTGARRGPKG